MSRSIHDLLPRDHVRMSERSTAKSAQKIPINATFMISSNYSQRSSAPCPQSIPLPSALATARIINDIGRIAYPDGIRSPKGELNANAKDGKFMWAIIPA